MQIVCALPQLEDSFHGNDTSCKCVTSCSMAIFTGSEKKETAYCLFSGNGCKEWRAGLLNPLNSVSFVLASSGLDGLTFVVHKVISQCCSCNKTS